MTQEHTAAPDQDREANPYRLPRSVEPEHYTISLRPDLESSKFSGSEIVRIKIHELTSRIVLHALDLAISEAFLRRSTQRPHMSANVTFNQELETATLDFEKMLEPGRAELVLIFQGELNDKMHGFYRTSHQIKGMAEAQWGAATQFEVMGARRAFPCWDEPDRKATFQISLMVPQALTVLSNRPVTQVIPTGREVKTVRFAETCLVSTCHVAFSCRP